MSMPVGESFLASVQIHAIDGNRSIKLLKNAQVIQQIACTQGGLPVLANAGYNPTCIPLSVSKAALEGVGELLWNDGADSSDFQTKFPTSELQHQATLTMLECVKKNIERRSEQKLPLFITKKEIYDEVTQKTAEQARTRESPRPVSPHDQALIEAGALLTGTSKELFESALSLWQDDQKSPITSSGTQSPLSEHIAEILSQNFQDVPKEEFSQIIQFAQTALPHIPGQHIFNLIDSIAKQLIVSNPGRDVLDLMEALRTSHMIRTAKELNLTTPSDLLLSSRKKTLDDIFSQIARENGYQLLPIHSISARYIQEFISLYNKKTKECLVQDIQSMGLKLPQRQPERSLEDSIISRDEFLKEVGFRNSFATIPSGHTSLVQFPRLRILAGAYEKQVAPLRSAWLTGPRYATMEKIQILTKQGLIRSLPVLRGNIIGRGKAKIASRFKIFKPAQRIVGVAGVIIDRERNKVIAAETNPMFVEGLFQECVRSQQLRRLKVYNTIHMRQIAFLSPDGQVISCGAMMELCAGGNLLEFIHQHQLSLEKKIQFVRQLCQSIRDLHNQGYRHNDLKAENIFVAFDPDSGTSIRLGDFGNMLPINEKTGFGTFISPEQYESALRHETMSSLEESDAYVLGSILGFICTGKDFLRRNNLDASSMLQRGYITQGNPPSADPKKAESIRENYVQMYQYWKERATHRTTPEDILAPVIMHLLDPTSVLRWTAQQALDFIEKLPLPTPLR